MPDELNHEADRDQLGYEPRDVAWRTVLWLAAATSAAVVIVLLAAEGLFVLLAQRPPTRTERRDAQAAPADLAQQLQTLRQQEEKRLGSYGWVSQRERIVRIPIERAIDLWIEEQESP